MKLPQSFIDELLTRTDIIEIIEQRITLKKTGQANYQGLCPFHNERTPSFSASQHKQFYYCFGCKASGNAIGFLMAYDKLTFLEAVEILAGKANMSLPETTTLATTKVERTHVDLLEKSAKYFQGVLKKQQTALDYLKKRGLDQATLVKFGIGYAPPGWHNLLDHLGQSLPIKQKLQEAGMALVKNDRWFDRFRERIMFPIHNRKGQVIAFGGRSLGDQAPKYLNSPETPVFHKSRELYGLYQVLQSNHQLQQLIMVEGYLDVIALHQFGITTAVGTLGTAVTAQHIHLLLRYAKELIFCFDSDLAGNKAAWKALEIILPHMNEGINVRFLFLPNGEDPDSFIRKEGKEKFVEVMKRAISLTDYFFQHLAAQTEIDSIAGKTRLAHLADKMLRQVPKGIFQQLMYERLSQLVGLSLTKLEEILITPTKSKEKKEPIAPPILENLELDQTVKLALSLLVQSPSLAAQCDFPLSFDEVQLAGMTLFRKVMAEIDQNTKHTTATLLEHFSEDPAKPLLIELATLEILIPETAWKDELQGILLRIKDLDREQRIQDLLAKGGREGLTTEEKLLLQRLLAIRQ